MNYKNKLTKGFVAFILFLLMFIPVSYGQTSPNTPSGYSIDSMTGNLIPFDNSLKSNNGWSSTSGSPAWIPNASPQGSFTVDGYTFSYIKEEMGVNGISLSNFPHGYQNTSAVFVTGFIYGLKYRFPCANSIGGYCEDPNGPQDNLRVEIGYYPGVGIPEFRTHQLGLKNINDGNPAYNPNWQTLAETWTFAGAKPLAQAGSVNMGIIGQDTGFWACIMPTCYGPQVKDAYLRATYSVDPCILNPAFNPSCPGFQNVLQGAKSPTFYYSYNIAQSLPHIGGGVILHGYDYGFNWYNYGACYNTFLFWCTDWRTDGGGNINFRISDKNNNTMLQQQWYVAGNNSGGGYSNRYLFTESRNSLDMGSVQWWTSDVWNHFGWSGWTRPIWTPDPCFDQPLYSPNCSNFDAEIKRLASEQKAIQEAQLATTVASVSTTPTSTVTTTISDATTTNPTVTVVTSQSTNEQQTKSTQSTPTTPSINIQQDNTSLALSLIRQNQNRETAIANQSSQQAIQSAANSANASIKQANEIALDAAKKGSIETNNEQHTISETTLTKNDITLNIGPNPGSTSVVNLAIQQRNTQGQTNIIDAPVISTSTSAIVQFNAMNIGSIQQAQTGNPLQPPIITQQQVATQQSYTPPAQTQINEVKTFENVQQERTSVIGQVNILQQPTSVSIEVQQQGIQTQLIPPIVTVDIPTVASNFISDKTNPINEIIEAKPIQQDNDKKETKTQLVKPNVQDNDVAGGVSINNLAVLPVGFNAYNIALRDVAFYAPKEIYRNQKTVDNVRALRQLASDRLHQEMVDQQYRR